MRVTLGGERWDIRQVKRIVTDGQPCLGKCYFDEKVIRICRGQVGRESLDTHLHEALHAIFPWLDEYAVERAGSELAELVHDRLGYRRPEC